MAEPRNETQLTKRIVDTVRREYPTIWHLKTHGDGYQRAGIPDLMFVHRGRLLAVEVKHQKPGESVEHLLTRVSARQNIELNDLRAAGATAIVAWTVEQVLEALDALEH